MNSSRPAVSIGSNSKLSEMVAQHVPSCEDRRVDDVNIGVSVQLDRTSGPESIGKLLHSDNKKGFEEGKSIDISFSLPSRESMSTVASKIDNSGTTSMLDLILSTQQVSLAALREHCFLGLLPIDPALELAGRLRVDNGGFIVSPQAEPGSIAYFDIDLKFYCGVSLPTADTANSGEVAASLRAKQVFLPFLGAERGESLGLTEDQLRKLLEYARTTCVDRRQWHYEKFLVSTWLNTRPKVDPSPVLRAAGLDGKALYEGLQACFPNV